MPTPLTQAEVASVVHAATLAPSVLNTQPWRFVARTDGVLELHRDTSRVLPSLDPQHRALTISCGAALLNLRLAIVIAGRLPEVQLLPDASDTSLLATVRALEPASASPVDVRLHDMMIWRRRTSRVPFIDQPLAPEMIMRLEAGAVAERASLRILDTPAAAEATRLVHEADEAQRANPVLRAEIVRWVHRGPDGVDGIPAAALGPAARDPASLVRDLTMGVPVRGRPSDDFEPEPTLGLLLTDLDEPVDWMRAGQALERIWLEATAAGIALSLLTQPLELSHLRWLARPLAVSEQPDRPADGPTTSSRPTPARWPQVLFRIGNALSSTPPTPRRSVADVLSFRSSAGD